MLSFDYELCKNAPHRVKEALVLLGIVIITAECTLSVSLCEIMSYGQMHLPMNSSANHLEMSININAGTWKIN